MAFIDECKLVKFYERRQQELMMFTWVQCLKLNLPTISTHRAITQFLDYFNIDGDVPSLNTTYYRILAELKESEKA
jgi:hypothetical protein